MNIIYKRTTAAA